MTYTGDAGTIACQNRSVEQLSAAGVLGLFGGATCAEGIGGGTFTWDERTVDSTFTWLGTGGSLSGGAMSGTFQLTAIGGDCHSGVVTKAHLRSLAIIPDAALLGS